MLYTNTKKFLTFFFLTAALLNFGFGKDEVITSQWTLTPPNIDGMDQDWKDFNLTDQKNGVKLGFRNDAKYLYILFSFTNPKYLTTVDLTGLTVYFNREGKKDKDFGINLRKIQINADEFITRLEKEQGPLTEEQKTQYRANQAYLLFYCGIIKKGSEQILEADTSKGIRPTVFRVQPQQNCINYEIALPLEKTTELAAGINIQPGEKLTIGFEWGGWTKELKAVVAGQMGDSGTRAQDQKSSDSMEELTGGGGDPRGAGGMRMGDSPDIATMRKRQPKKYDFWVNIEIAAGNQ